MKTATLELIVGIPVMFILFSGLHFLYDSTGIAFFSAFSAVNESVWEHLKIGFFSGLFYAIFEYFHAFKGNKNFFTAKALGLMALVLFIIVVFYTYTAFTGHSILWVDILTAFLSCALCQYTSYRIITSQKSFERCEPFFAVVLLAMTFCFIIFTYFPPKLGIFMPGGKEG